MKLASYDQREMSFLSIDHHHDQLTLKKGKCLSVWGAFSVRVGWVSTGLNTTIMSGRSKFRVKVAYFVGCWLVYVRSSFLYVNWETLTFFRMHPLRMQ